LKNCSKAQYTEDACKKSISSGIKQNYHLIVYTIFMGVLLPKYSRSTGKSHKTFFRVLKSYKNVMLVELNSVCWLLEVCVVATVHINATHTKYRPLN